jgi:O-antigen ligase
MSAAAILSLAAILGYACFERAGVEPQTWNPCVAALGILAAVYFLAPRRRQAPRVDRLAAFSALAVVGIAALQLAPLPLGLVRCLAPERVALLRATVPVTGRLPGFVALSVAPYSTFQGLLTLAACAAVFFLVHDLTARSRRQPWATVWPLITVAGLEALLGFLQASGAGDGQATGTYNSRDHYAGLLEMAQPFAPMYALAVLQRNRRPHGMPVRAAAGACAFLLVAGVLLIATVFSLSRMGFFCALAGLLTAGVLVFSARTRSRDGGATLPPWRRALPFAVVMAVVAVAFVFLPTDALIARFSSFASTDEITADARFQLWRDTGPLLKDYPWFGCGFGTYESCFLRYKTVAPMNTADFAHNDYLQAFAELGLLGFAAGMLFVARALAGAGRRVLHASSADERCRAIACAAAMTAMLAHSFVDFNMYVPANAFVFAWIAGVAVSSWSAPDAESKSRHAVEAGAEGTGPGVSAGAAGR